MTVITEGKTFPKSSTGMQWGGVRGQTALEEDQYGVFKRQTPSLPPHVHTRSFSVMEILQMRSSRGASLEDANDNTGTRVQGRKEGRRKGKTRLLPVTHFGGS